MESSLNALTFGAQMATSTGAEMILLHLAGSEEKVQLATPVMNVWKEKLAAMFSGSIHTIVTVGDIFEDIGKISAEKKCDLVIMPTHGMNGSQQITGSLALNVVTASNTPFLVVQQKPMPERGFKKIVIPVEYRQQLLEAATFFRDIALHHQSEVFLAVNSRAETGQNKEVLQSFNDTLNEAGIPVQIHTLSKYDFSNAVAEFAASIDAHLICTINFSYENLYTINPRTDEEDLIYNKEGIPVLLFTPEDQDDDLFRPLADM
jgi:hypothetical protein